MSSACNFSWAGFRALRAGVGDYERALQGGKVRDTQGNRDCVPHSAARGEARARAARERVRSSTFETCAFYNTHISLPLPEGRAVRLRGAQQKIAFTFTPFGGSTVAAFAHDDGQPRVGLRSTRRRSASGMPSRHNARG